MKLYHFTAAKNLPGIRKCGLRPHVGAMSEWGKVVWFTTFGPRPGEARALVVEIDRSDSRLEFAERLRPGAEWYVFRGAIPPDQIEFPEPPTQTLLPIVK